MRTIIGTLSPGRLLFAAGTGALGLQSLILADFLWLEPVAPWLPARAAWAGTTGAILMLASLLIVADRNVRSAAGVLGLVLFLWTAAMHLPVLILEPGHGGVWGSAFKIVALAGAAWLLSALPSGRRLPADRRVEFIQGWAAPARICFGTALLVFGILHFAYSDYIASLIPGWVPGRSYWPWFTGVAQIAAAGSVLTAVKMRLAASLLAVMYGLWVLMLHVPRVLSDLHDAQEWTDLFMAVALCGGALLVAGSAAAAGENRTREIGPTASEIGQ